MWAMMRVSVLWLLLLTDSLFSVGLCSRREELGQEVVEGIHG